MGYKYILFDADNTLFDFDRSEYEALDLVMREYGIEIDEKQHEVYHEINDRLWKMLEVGEIEREKLKTERFVRFFEYLGIEMPDTAENVAHNYVEKLSLQNFLLPGAEEVCRELSPRYKLYLITNGLTFVQKRRISNSPLKKYFTDFFISEEVGYAKPEKAFFEYVSDSIGDSDKSDYIVVGDSLTSDIQGAVNFGVDSVWICPGGLKDDRPTYTVNTVSDILKIL